MATIYPDNIDGYSQLRVVRNRIDEIIAEDINDLRSAVISIEQTLGINPQGPFGTVVARLNDAYSNIEAHVLGNPPRHQDTVIESAARTGTIYSLSMGTVGSQLQQLLDAVNVLRYLGSGAKTFADGYALPASALRGAVSEIVGQIGRTTGDTKVGAAAKTSTKFSLASGSVSSQITSLLSQLDSQGANLPGVLFYGVVVSGMVVTRMDAMSVDVSAGTVIIDGNTQKYAGAKFVHTGAGTHYLYATINSSNAVVINETSNMDVFMGTNGNPYTATLAQFTETGAGFSSFYDLRRFGLFMNNKPFITVGADGYGADFTSLKSATEYITLIQSTTTNLNKIRKIAIVSDITVSSTDLPITLFSGLEIDGNNHKITWSTNTNLFSCPNGVQDTVLKNIRAVYSGATSVNSSFINYVSSGSFTNRHKILNCYVSGTNLSYFVHLGGTLPYKIDSLEIKDCFATVLVSHLWSDPLEDPPPYCIITGNKFLQSGSIASSSYAAIRVRENSIVSNNTIVGGFFAGIDAHEAQNSVISNNAINGGSGLTGLPGTPYMDTGILISTSASYSDDHAIVNGNTISGVINHGIYLYGTINQVIVSSNIIDNTWNTSATMEGITDTGSDNVIDGNYILVPGTYGIRDACYAVNNYILGDATQLVTYAVSVSALFQDSVVSNNYIIDCIGTAIYGNNATGVRITNNMIIGCAGSTNAIALFGEHSIVSNNLFDACCGAGVSACITNSIGGKHCLIDGNVILNPRSNAYSGIYLYDGYATISNNILGGLSGYMPLTGIFVNNKTNCNIINNTVFGNKVRAGTVGAIDNVGDFCSVDGNYIQNANTFSIYMTGNHISCNKNFIANSDSYSIYGYNGSFTSINSNTIISSNYHAIYVWNSPFTAVRDNFVYNSTHDGICLIQGTNNSIVSGNFIHTTPKIGTSRIAIEINACGYGIITSNYTYNTGFSILASIDSYSSIINGNYSMNDAYGIYCGGSVNDVPTYDIVCNNYIRNTTGFYSGAPNGTAIAIFPGGRATIVNNYMMSNTGPGIQMGNDCRDCLIAGNYIENTNSSWTAMFLNAGSHNCIISNNFLRNLGRAGIKILATSILGGCDNVTISGNVIDTCVENGILMYPDCNYCSIFDNTIINSTLTPILIESKLNIFYAASAQGNMVCNNRIYNTGSCTDAYGISILGDTGTGTNCNYSVVRGNYIVNSGGAGGVGGIGLYAADNSCVEQNYLILNKSGISILDSNYTEISNNYVYTVSGNSIELDGGVGHALIGNHIYGAASSFAGILIGSASSQNLVASNIVNGFNTTAFNFTGVKDSCFNGNMCTNPLVNSANGMVLTSCVNCLVTGNYCYGGASTGKGFVLDSSPNIEVSGNFARGSGAPTGFNTTYLTSSSIYKA